MNKLLRYKTVKGIILLSIQESNLSVKKIDAEINYVCMYVCLSDVCVLPR